MAYWLLFSALMNEYRVPELNIQNGVLNALSLLFEHIGELEKDFVYAASPGDFGLNLLYSCTSLRIVYIGFKQAVGHRRTGGRIFM